MKKPFNVKIGVNPISWSNDDLPALGGETPLEVALTEGKAIGYEGFELGNKFPRESAALRDVLAQHGLALVSGWYSGRLVQRSAEEEIAAADAHLRLLADNGAMVVVYGEVADSIQGTSAPLFKRPRFFRQQQWAGYAEKLNAFARHTLSRGLRTAYHHHIGAYVETPADVDRLMALTSDDVGLLFDSGHITFAGGDAAQVLAQHVKRVCHVHCKDVRADVISLARNRNWSFLQAVINGAFTVPGDGAIDFGPLLDILYDNGYEGWLVVEAEQDPAVAPSYAYADKGYRHLREIVTSMPRTMTPEADTRPSYDTSRAERPNA